MTITAIGAVIALVGILIWLFAGPGFWLFIVGVVVALVGLATGR